jgi:hypothetical protein
MSNKQLKHPYYEVYVKTDKGWLFPIGGKFKTLGKAKAFVEKFHQKHPTLCLTQKKGRDGQVNPVCRGVKATGRGKDTKITVDGKVYSL